MANNMVSYWCATIFDNFKGSVVRLGDEKHFYGNGFVVYNDNNTCLILTCQHVLPKDNNGNVVVGSTVGAMFHTGVRFDAQVAYVDVDRDLALLRAYNTVGIPLRFWEYGGIVSGIDVVLGLV